MEDGVLIQGRSVLRACLLAASLAACGPSLPALGQSQAAMTNPAHSSATPAPVISTDPFPGRAHVSVSELFAALAGQVPAVAHSPAVRRDYEVLRAQYRLAHSDALYLDYVRVKLAFETTRAGGLWGLTWRITDQLPQSDRVWTQWRQLRLADGPSLPQSTAIAECDELSALFAFTAHQLGLSGQSQVGLLWPTSNHTVAVWTIGDPRTGARVVVPTSQIFLDGAQSLGTKRFDPWKQKNIFDYRRRDIAPDTRLPAPLARGLIRSVEQHGARSQADLQALRNQRENRQRAQVL